MAETKRAQSAEAVEQPTDLLSARAGANRPTGFFDKPGVRKFVRNRPGMISLLVIVLFVLVAALIAMPPHLISLNQVQGRVGPGNLPGFGRASNPDDRIEVADFFLSAVEKALDSSDPEAALAELRFAERAVQPMPVEDAEAALESSFEAFDLLDEALIEFEDAEIEIENLVDSGASEEEFVAPRAALEQARAGFETSLDALEVEVEKLFPVPTGWSGFVYKIRLLAGTDRQGRSIAFRAIFSIKTATQIGMVTAIFSIFIGAILGGAAGFFGGIIDHAVVWLYSTLSSIPYIIWLIVIAFVFRESTLKVPFTDKPISQTLLPVYMAFGVTLWVGTCRVIRGEAMKIKSLDYIQSAISIGASPARILLKHVLPNVMYLLFINFSLAFVAAIKGEVILSYLGLGVQGQPSWGVMIRDSKEDVVLGVFWELGAATVLMFVLVYAFNILSDALQDAFDPKHVG
ncbi:MAG: ABC transporter permease [Planctomycetota bacterium]|nr:ABC transporter permease [Planctomycetota bacterium]